MVRKKITATLFIAFALFVIKTNIVQAVTPPTSSYISISKGSIIQTLGSGMDIWVNSWGTDGNLYTAYGDGKGFSNHEKLSMGLAKLNGNPPSSVSGTDIRTASFEELGDGPSGKKPSGMVMVNGTLYVLVRNANNNGQQCQLAWSNSPYTNWSWSSWKFTQYGYCSFANYGQNYGGAIDNYVYAFFSNTPSAYDSTDTLLLARVDKAQITNQSAYQFFSGTTSNPSWGGTPQPILTHTGGVNRHDVTYDAAVGRYLMTMRSREQTNHFSIYESANPWGPWSIAYTQPNAGTGNTGMGESQHIPSKWLQSLSGGKQDFYLIHAGGDQLNIQEFTITLLDGSTPTPTSSLTNTMTPTKTPTPTTSKPGDANGDGKVDGLDYVVWLTNYNKTVSGGASQGDFDGSGKVDGLDYVIWLTNYGK